jgi:hypothetical protein
MYELLGEVVGAVLGLLGPFLYAQIYAVRAPDPTAAGALVVFVFITVPAGIVIGAAVGFIIRTIVKRKH